MINVSLQITDENFEPYSERLRPGAPDLLNINTQVFRGLQYIVEAQTRVSETGMVSVEIAEGESPPTLRFRSTESGGRYWYTNALLGGRPTQPAEGVDEEVDYDWGPLVIPQTSADFDNVAPAKFSAEGFEATRGLTPLEVGLTVFHDGSGRNGLLEDHLPAFHELVVTLEEQARRWNIYENCAEYPPRPEDEWISLSPDNPVAREIAVHSYPRFLSTAYVTVPELATSWLSVPQLWIPQSSTSVLRLQMTKNYAQFEYILESLLNAFAAYDGMDTEAKQRISDMEADLKRLVVEHYIVFNGYPQSGVDL
jgi:hypothetical protein